MRELMAVGDGAATVSLRSAGLEAEEGEPPPPEVIAVMEEYGLDVAGHRAHRLQREDVEEADLILTMAMHNPQRLLTEHQEAVGRVFTLKEFVIQGERHGRELAEADPEKRLRELRKWIRHVEGLEAAPGEGNVNEKLRLFFLHYFHVYDHRFSIDDPLGQSMHFMRRTAEEIREAVHRLAGADLLGLI